MQDPPPLSDSTHLMFLEHLGTVLGTVEDIKVRKHGSCPPELTPSWQAPKVRGLRLDFCLCCQPAVRPEIIFHVSEPQFSHL